MYIVHYTQLIVICLTVAAQSQQPTRLHNPGRRIVSHTICRLFGIVVLSELLTTRQINAILSLPLLPSRRRVCCAPLGRFILTPYPSGSQKPSVKRSQKFNVKY